MEFFVGILSWQILHGSGGERRIGVQIAPGYSICCISPDSEVLRGPDSNEAKGPGGYPVGAELI